MPPLNPANLVYLGGEKVGESIKVVTFHSLSDSFSEGTHLNCIPFTHCDGCLLRGCSSQWRGSVKHMPRSSRTTQIILALAVSPPGYLRPWSFEFQELITFSKNVGSQSIFTRFQQIQLANCHHFRKRTFLNNNNNNKNKTRKLLTKNFF